ncbi:MAG: hypothetical protein GWM90_28500 [Gemmatimonadetes bacterium]|nr:hypothetical protein [Gemmatimonadota bacterium]NIQ58977.1 hypothetical protein [Gemmatimonadota bacterium]NIU79184.1 hypothetical protein [Gammaproteobacteria bacterium]NIX47868.1 hypothetical protein [Gemmatimonadota bacterium]NIY12239.1 hypothetical protein [Gemmatimonadota bacterium]
MIYPVRQVPLRSRIPTVRVRLATDDGELTFRARWKDRPIDLQRRILFLMRQGQPIFLEDEWGHGVCLRPECVWGASVDGRPDGPRPAPRAPASGSRPPTGR